MPVFALPLALIALTSLPMLAAIYWMRSRHHTRIVSTLSLWVDQRTPREGGRRLQRLQLPLLFLLELLALLLLTAAAAGPVLHDKRIVHRIVVVLDDSYSMRADASGGKAGTPDTADTPRDRAVQAIHEVLRDHQPFSVRFVLAGTGPQVVGDAVSTMSAVDEQLRQWHGQAPGADLYEALATARQIAPEAEVLVMTDHKPASMPAGGRVQWRAFGRSLPNIAFVNAVRQDAGAGHRVLLAVANLSAKVGRTTLTAAGKPMTLSLQPWQVRRMWFDLPADAPAFRASLGDDGLAADNRVVLLPSPRQRLRVRLAVGQPRFAAQLRRALLATGRVHLVGDHPQLRIADRAPATQPAASTADETWRLRLMIADKGPAYVGPFVYDRSHPLTRGLSLAGVVWGAAKTGEMPGAPVLAAGDVPLLTDLPLPGGRHLLRLRIVPGESTLGQTPAMPILMWNLVAWRLAHTPGLRQVNFPLGASATLALPRDVKRVRVQPPTGESREAPAVDAAVRIAADEVGVYTVTSGESGASAPAYRFAVNVLDRGESDLSGAATGRWGQWKLSAGEAWHDRHLAWVLLLLALGVLALHAVLLARHE